MKKINKITNVLSTLLITLVFVFTAISSISAAPSSTVIRQDGNPSKSYIGTEGKDEYQWAKFITSDGKIAYCMDVDKKWPDAGTNMSLDGEANAGIKYILEHGYPNKKMIDGGEIDRFITQAAVWWYLHDIGQGTISEVLTTTGAEAYTGTRDNIKSLVAGAKKAGSTAKASLDVDVNNSNMTLSSDKKYYESVSITPSLSGASTYKVSVSGATGAIVTTTAGNTQSEFKAGDKFIIKVPASSINKTTTLSVKVSATYTTNKAYIFKPGDTSYQRVVALYENQQSLEKTVSLTAKPEPKPTPGDKPSVCVDYVIVGNVKPDPAKTDPTPGKNCYDKGTKYDQEKELTTRQTNCKFNGWYTKSDLTGKWTNGTALNKDMTLYGAWDCGTEVTVPATAANTPLVIFVIGSAAIIIGLGLYFYRSKNIVASK